MIHNKTLAENVLDDLLPLPPGAENEPWRARLMSLVFDTAAQAGITGSQFRILNAIVQRVLGFHNYGRGYLTPRRLAEILEIDPRTIRRALKALCELRILDIEKVGGKIEAIRIHPRFYDSKKPVDKSGGGPFFGLVRTKMSAFSPPRTPIDTYRLYNVRQNRYAVDKSPPRTSGVKGNRPQAPPGALQPSNFFKTTITAPRRGQRLDRPGILKTIFRFLWGNPTRQAGEHGLSPGENLNQGD